MNKYTMPVCAVSCRSDHNIRVEVGTEEDVVALMMDELGQTEDSINDNYLIEEDSISISIPQSIIDEILEGELIGYRKRSWREHLLIKGD